MSSAKITLFGMYKYMEQMHEYDPASPQLFDQLSFPEGIDQETFIYNTLDRGGEFETIYSDPNILYEKVRFWSSKWYRTFEKWVAALNIEYDPLYNYDRTEEETRTPNLTDKRTPDLERKRTANLTDERTANLTDKRTADLTDTRTANLTDKRTANLTDLETPNTTNTLNGSRTEEREVSAFDSSSYQPAEKVTVTDNAHTEALTGSNTTTHTGTDTTEHTGTDTNKETGTDTKTQTGTDTMKHTGTDTEKETGTDTRTQTGTEKWNRRAYGNIGVTTSQQMLEAELTISEWNLYDHISDVFLREFCIPVYV